MCGKKGLVAHWDLPFTIMITLLFITIIIMFFAAAALAKLHLLEYKWEIHTFRFYFCACRHKFCIFYVLLCSNKLSQSQIALILSLAFVVLHNWMHVTHGLMIWQTVETHYTYLPALSLTSDIRSFSSWASNAQPRFCNPQSPVQSLFHTYTDDALINPFGIALLERSHLFKVLINKQI